MFEFQEGEKKFLVSYVQKKNKSIVALSGMHSVSVIDNERLIIMDMTKGGVYMIDQMCNAYSIACITRLWSVVVFLLLINMAGIIYVSSLLFQCKKSQNYEGSIFEELVHVADDAISYSYRQYKVTCSGYDSIPFAVSGTNGKGRYM